MIGKACPGFPVAGNALSSAADCPSPVPDLSDLSSASDHSLTSLTATAQTFLYPGDQPPPPSWPHWPLIAGCAVPVPCRGLEEVWAGVCRAGWPTWPQPASPPPSSSALCSAWPPASASIRQDPQPRPGRRQRPGPEVSLLNLWPGAGRGQTVRPGVIMALASLSVASPTQMRPVTAQHGAAPARPLVITACYSLILSLSAFPLFSLTLLQWLQARSAGVQTPGPGSGSRCITQTLFSRHSAGIEPPATEITAYLRC